MSPVAGERESFTKLSPKYKKLKAKVSGSGKPNMELYGDMLDEFDVRTDGNKVTIGFHKDASETTKLKAENHNKFTKRAMATKVPRRRFIPSDAQNFRSEIMEGVHEIVADAIREESGN